MPSYKLYYFNGRGRAELTRLLFTLAGQEFEDVRLAGETWQAFKPKTPTGQLPVLEVDGTLHSQSVAIATFVAREFGYYGKTNQESFRIDQTLGIIGDLLNQAVKAMFAEESKKEEATKEFLENQAPKFFASLQKMLKESGTGYFVGSTVTLADIAVYDLCFSMGERFSGILDKFPDLEAHKQKIGNLDRIKQYVAKRQPTNF